VSDAKNKILKAVEAIPYISDPLWEKVAPITVVEYRRHVLAVIRGEESYE
jgi:hypothetical protein